MGMGDYERKQQVAAPAQQLFDYLADVGNLPAYMDSMVSAEPAEGEAVRVTANVDGREYGGEAWFRVDRERQHLEWGSEGDNDYRGELDVTGDDERSEVTVTLHTEQAEGQRIEQGLEQTLANVQLLVETGPAPSS